MEDKAQGERRFMPPNLGWGNAMWRLALLNELLVLVGGMSMYAVGVLSTSHIDHPSMAYQVVWMHCIGLCALVVMGGTSLWTARRAWARIPEPEARYAASGAYPGLDSADRLRLCLSTLVAGVVSAILAWWLMGCLAPLLATLGPAPPPPLELAFFNTAYGALAVYASEYVRDRVTWSRYREQRALQLGAQAQLDLLRSQLEPHMLFNTLANVNELIDEDPARAKAMLFRLNDFLRATLQGSRTVHHALSDEFKLVADYLALMHMRMGDRLTVSLTLPDDLASAQVPAMLLQPLVENAIQHGLAPRRAGGSLRVSAARCQQGLRLDVCSTGAATSALTQGQGLGLKLVRDRLQAHHGHHATFTLKHLPHDDTTRATVELPLLPNHP